MAHNTEYDVYVSDFEELMEEYVIPAATFPIETWTTEDLVKLHLIIDAELQHRAYMQERADACAAIGV